MKKFMFLALPALVLASCSSDEAMDVAKGSGISFEPAIAKGSRALEVNTANLQEFNVSAYSATEQFFTDVTIKRENNLWTSEYLWPNYNLDFVAYSPVEFGGKANINSTRQTLNDVKIEQKIADQKDIVVARNNNTKPGEKVKLHFDHALSAIQVKAKLANENLHYEIMAVKLCNLMSKGSFTYPAVAESGFELADFTNGSWSNLTEYASYISRGDASKPVNLTTVGELKDLMAVEKDMFMPLPQSVEGWNLKYDTSNDGFYVSILCRIWQDNHAGGEVQLFPKTEGKYGFAAIPVKYDFQPGKKYTLVLSLDGGGYRDPDDTDPDNPNPDPDDPDNPIDPTPDPDDPDDPDPILPGKISYDITVEDWSEEIEIPIDYTHPDNN